MKKLMFAFCFVFGGLVAVNAQDTTSTSQQQEQYPTQQNDESTMQQDQDRERINSRDLPDAVKRSLEGQEYRGWLVNAAYKTSDASGQTGSQSGNEGMSSDSTSYRTQGNQGNQGSQSDTTSVSGNEGSQSGSGEEVYVVELKNGAQTKTVRFDKDGKKLDDQGSGQDDQK